MRTPFDFLTTVARRLSDQRGVHVYAGYRPGGSLLIRTEGSHRILFRASDSSHLIGRQKILDAIERWPAFKGQSIDTWVFLARGFRPNAFSVAKSHRAVFVQIDEATGSATIAGSANLPAAFLRPLIQAAERGGFTVFSESQPTKPSPATMAQLKSAPPIAKHPTAFLSYSWDGEEHRLWVLRLAGSLIRNGVEVLIDEWDLAEYGHDLHEFMETGIRDADFVIMVCTPNYAKRSNHRQGGVGIESTIITGEFYDSKHAGKYIPIVKAGTAKISDSLPGFLRSKFSIDFSDDRAFEQNLENLLRRIAGRPRYRKPALGQFPKFQSDDI